MCTYIIQVTLPGWLSCPYVVKRFQKSSLEPLNRFQPNLMACSISLAYYIFVHVMSLTYFTTRSKLAAYAFEWGKLLKGHLKGKYCIGQNIYDSEKWTQWFVFPPTHSNIYVYYNYIQTFLLKPLDQSKSNIYETSIGKGNMNVYMNSQGHITNMAAMPVYG